jgi:hypothetical protein
VARVENPLRRHLRTAPHREVTRAPARADDLAELMLEDSEGRDVRLGDTWRDGPVALVWLRHYG